MRHNFKHFLKGTFLISFGAVISQLIMLVALPVLTRIYSPEDFGHYGLYLFFFSLFTVLASLRYEQGIAITKTQLGAIYLVLISIVLSVLVGLLIFLFGFMLNMFLEMGDDNIHSYLVYSTFLALAIMFSGTYQALEFWAVRQKKYKEIAFAKALRAVGLSLSQIVFGLIEGHWVGQFVGGLRFLKLYFKTFKSNVKKISKRKIVWAFKRYKEFPKYDLWAVVISVLSSQAPIIFLMFLYSAEMAGYFMLALSLLSAPIGLIGKAVSQVLLSHSKDALVNGVYVKSIYLKVFRVLVKIAVVPFFLIMLIPQDFFVFLLGEKWLGAGVVIFWTAVWVMFQFIFSPLSVLFSVKEAQVQHRNLQIGFFFFRVVSLLIPYSLGASGEEALIVFSLVNVLCYLFGIYYVLKLIDIDLPASAKIMIIDLLLGLGLFLSVMLLDMTNIIYFIIIVCVLVWVVLLWKELRNVELQQD
ncbi:oligosaccharide flippase family protein [Thiomicrorhabdus lithotrophica]|uniref:Oligosaccharide flippase family protein n=1 Tax=Thiomicrorhabdus lithotrophica TaxID=2949997 RepID=A0ABY8CAZ6_9GAMM|nr:oligosaccharide flippase family protein [Thiomicrorhabdus lithotrophica]WEJ63146.1 oligosaccharide flippase family protein [Thiomicrorhabdus lithotrophica]